MSIVFSLLVLAAMVFTIVDIITREPTQVRYMPKAVWVILVILVPLLGVVLWFALGREHTEGATRPARPPRAARVRPTRGVRHAPAGPPVHVDTRSTEQQLADLEREIEEERLRAELRRRQQGESHPSAG